MAYLAIKKVDGKHYAYLQESYREGGKVRTRTVEYLGAIAPSVADQVRATRKQLGQADMAALVASVRSAAAGVAEAATVKLPKETQAQPEHPAITEAPSHSTPTESDSSRKTSHEPARKSPITTGKDTERPYPPAPFLQWPDDLEQFNVNRAAMGKTQARFADRLQAMGVDPAAMPKVQIVYGHPDRMRRNRDGSYTITASRRTQNKRHQMNKTKLWQHTRQALSLAYLDALAEAQPEVHHQMQSELDTSHQATKQMLVRHFAEASNPIDRLGLSLQLSVWHSVPQRLLKKATAEEFGQASFETLKDWRAEAAFVLAEAHKKGWDGMADRNRKARGKLKSAITRQKTQLDQMGMVERLGARLSGKRRRIIREIMAKEAKLQSVDRLEQRQRVLRRHFPL